MILNDVPVSTAELSSFVAALSDRHFTGLKAEYPTCEHNWEKISVQIGTKYARLVTTFVGNVRSTMGFIDLTNGNILKAAGWKGPAKHARGNIRSGDASNLWNGAFTAAGGGCCVAYRN
jgi:hypothetical protein